MVTPCLYCMHICTLMHLYYAHKGYALLLYTILLRVILYMKVTLLACVYTPLYYVLYMILLYSKGYIILQGLYYIWRVTLLACVYTCKACFYSCIVNFITITLYVPETLTILVFHTYKYTYFKYCKYSSTPCNSK